MTEHSTTLQGATVHGPKPKPAPAPAPATTPQRPAVADVRRQLQEAVEADFREREQKCREAIEQALKQFRCSFTVTPQFRFAPTSAAGTRGVIEMDLSAIEVVALPPEEDGDAGRTH